MKGAIGIEFTTNMFGFLPSYLKSALYEYIQFPNQDNWNEIYGVVITGKGKMTTVWQAVIEVDASYNVRLHTNVSGDNEWPKIPSSELLIKAINNVVFSNVNVCLN